MVRYMLEGLPDYKENFERVQRHLQHAIADRDAIRTQTIRECAAIVRRFCFMPAVETRQENDGAKIEDEILALAIESEIN